MCHWVAESILPDLGTNDEEKCDEDNYMDLAMGCVVCPSPTALLQPQAREPTFDCGYSTLPTEILCKRVNPSGLPACPTVEGGS